MTGCARILACLLGLLLVLIVSPARADNLADIIPNLFGTGGITLRTVPLPGFPQGHSPHFLVNSEGELTSVNDALRQGLLNAPLPSPASGFTFEFDPTLGTVVRSSEGFGPIYADRAETLGKGRFALGFSYSRFDYKELDGRDLDGDINLTFRHEPTAALAGRPQPFFFEADTVTARLNVDITQDVFLFAGTYGILDSLDVSIAIPIIRIDMSASGTATSNQETGTNIHVFQDGSTMLNAEDSDASTGIGDILLRAKWNFYRQKPYALATGLDLRLPSGSEDDLRGTGGVRVRPFFLASGTWGKVADKWGAVSPHVNVGFDLGSTDVVDNSFFYRVGVDWTPFKIVTFAVDILGQYIINNSRVQTNGQDAGNNVVDASVGLKANVWKNVLVMANVLFPLNDTGLRANFVPFVGIEVDF
jgi:hypothetical protein